MKTKRIILASIFAMLMIVAILPFGQSLEEVVSGDAPFNLASYLSHEWGIYLIDSYSIVGDARGCGYGTQRTAHKTYTNLKANSYTVVRLEDDCASGYGLIDIYVSGWNPYIEKAWDVGFTCKESSAPCNIEVYCCPYGWCDNLGGNSYCRQKIGSGSECKTSTKRDNNIELDFNSWSYCTQPTNYVDCWYSTTYGTSCLKRTYTGQNTCPGTYMGYNLYSSESLCLSRICDNACPQPSTVTCGDNIIPTKGGCSCTGTGTKCGSGKTCQGGVCVGDGTNGEEEIFCCRESVLFITNYIKYDNSEDCKSDILTSRTLVDESYCETEGEEETQPFNSVSIKSENLDSATATTWANAMCKLDSDCSNYNNYTSRCDGSDNIVDKGSEKIADSQPSCFSGGVIGGLFGGVLGPVLIGNLDCWKTWINTLTGKQVDLDTVQGFCIAESSDKFDYCEFTEWASLGIIDKSDKCKDGLWTILIVIVFLVVVLPLISPKK